MARPSPHVHAGLRDRRSTRRSPGHLQKLLENGSTAHARRKEPKYVTHGLHAFKGKFYPQLVKSLINMSGIPIGARLFDPYCGSGTTLLEGMLNGFVSYGCDFNPLATKIAHAKTAILSHAKKLRRALDTDPARSSVSQAGEVSRITRSVRRQHPRRADRLVPGSRSLQTQLVARPNPHLRQSDARGISSKSWSAILSARSPTRTRRPAYQATQGFHA